MLHEVPITEQLQMGLTVEQIYVFLHHSNVMRIHDSGAFEWIGHWRTSLAQELVFHDQSIDAVVVLAGGEWVQDLGGNDDAFVDSVAVHSHVENGKLPFFSLAVNVGEIRAISVRELEFAFGSAIEMALFGGDTALHVFRKCGGKDIAFGVGDFATGSVSHTWVSLQKAIEDSDAFLGEFNASVKDGSVRRCCIVERLDPRIESIYFRGILFNRFDGSACLYVAFPHLFWHIIHIDLMPRILFGERSNEQQLQGDEQ